MKKELRDMLIEGLKGLDIDIDENHIRLFDIYLQEILKWNAQYNLTAIKDEKSIIIKHFIDSSIVSIRNKCSCGNMVDIGSGAGFPGLILKILKPEIILTSVDANEKKIFFQKNVMRKISKDHIRFIANRVEDSGFIKEYKNFFDCAVVRAFKPVSEILTLAYPILKKGGLISIYKGKNYKKDLEEVDKSEVAGRFELQNVESYKLPFINRHHHILIYQKK
jgi:16S rRNA (guanine527-N7)-methyltransferase